MEEIAEQLRTQHEEDGDAWIVANAISLGQCLLLALVLWRVW